MKAVGGKTISALVASLCIAGSVLVMTGSQDAAAATSYRQVNEYATVMSKTYPIWQDMTSGKRVGTSSQYYHKTLQVRQVASQGKGKNYVALYTSAGTLAGYVHQDAVKLTTSPMGKFFDNRHYASVNTTAGTVYSNINGTVSGNTAKLYHHTLQVRYSTVAFSGQQYDSVYDGHGKWIGYVKSNVLQGGSNQLGAGYADNRNVSFMGSNYNIYWPVGHSRYQSKNLQHVTYYSKFLHNPYNGGQYLSLYTKSGSLLGIVNSNAIKVAAGQQGVPYITNQTVEITALSATLWKDFNWTPKAPAKNYKGQTLVAKGAYRHFNGATYDSLYTTGGSWVGYFNASGVKVVDGTHSSAGAPFSCYAYVATGKSTATPTYTAVNGKKTKTTLHNGQRVTTKRARLYGSTMWYQLTNGLWVTDRYVSLHPSTSSLSYSTSVNRNKIRALNTGRATIYSSAGGRSTGKSLSYSTVRTYTDRMVVNGEMWYKIGTNQWLRRKQACEILPYQNPSSYYQVQYSKIKPVGQVGYNLGYNYEGIKTWIVLGRLGLSRSYANMSSAAIAKVKAFQRAHGLPANGVVNLATWNKMGYSTALWNAIDSYTAPLGAQWYNDRSEHIEAMIRMAYKYLGKPYIVGASTSPSYGNDCSGLVTQALYAGGISPVPVSSIQHAHPGNEWNSRLMAATSKFKSVSYASRQRGDLIFYTNPADHRVWHVAIYLGGNRVIESWPPKVMVAAIKNSQRNWVTKVVRPFL